MVMAVIGPQPRHSSPLTPVRQRGGTPHRPTPPISTGQVAVGTHPKSPHSGGLRGRTRPTARPEACGCHGDATLPPPRVGLRPTASRTPRSRGLQLRAPNTGLGPTPPCPPPPAGPGPLSAACPTVGTGPAPGLRAEGLSLQPRPTASGSAPPEPQKIAVVAAAEAQGRKRPRRGERGRRGGRRGGGEGEAGEGTGAGRQTALGLAATASVGLACGERVGGRGCRTPGVVVQGGTWPRKPRLGSRGTAQPYGTGVWLLRGPRFSVGVWEEGSADVLPALPTLAEGVLAPCWPQMPRGT